MARSLTAAHRACRRQSEPSSWLGQAWVDNPIWLAGTLAITAMATFGTFFVTLSLVWQYVFGLIFVWAGIGTVITALKFGKWVATAGAVVRVLLMTLFTLTAIFCAVGHGVHGFGGGAFKPTWAVLLLAAPILIFDLEGFELPSSASEELKNPRRDVPFAVLRSGVGTLLFYAVLRCADPRHPGGAAPLTAVQRRRLRRRDEGRLRCVRRPHGRLRHRADWCRQGPRRHLRDRADLRPAVVGLRCRAGSPGSACNTRCHRSSPSPR
jgi:hypothetical protein